VPSRAADSAEPFIVALTRYFAGLVRYVRQRLATAIQRPTKQRLASRNLGSHAVHKEGELQMHHAIVVAHCPHCHSELPLGLEQAVRLRDGGRLWLFCPLCIRIVCADRIVSGRNSVGRLVAPATRGRGWEPKEGCR
jgi:RNase P subunit RPR2